MTHSNCTVLIGFADALSAPEVAFDLLESGLRVAAFVRKKARKPALSRCKGIELFEITAPETSVDASLSDLAGAYKQSGASAIMPLNDKALWLCDRLSTNTDIMIAGPTGPTAAFALDKRMQTRMAADAGFNIPQTVTLEHPSDIKQILCFPAIIKSALAVAEENGRLLKKEKLLFCADKDELQREIHAWNGKQPLIAQSVHRGDGEGLFGFATHEGITCWSAHRRVRMMNPKGSGSSACRSVPVTDQPVRQTEILLKSIGWQGPFMIELLLDENGKHWFVELNGRPWGSMALALRMGYQYPAWAIRHLFKPGFIPESPAPRHPVTCRHLGRELIHILQVLRGPSSSAIPNWPTIGQTLKQVLRIGKDDRWYNWRPYNKSVFFSDTYNTLMDETVRKWIKV